MRYDSESEANTTFNTNSFMQPSTSYYQHPRTSSTASIDSSHGFMTNGGNSCNNSFLADMRRTRRILTLHTENCCAVPVPRSCGDRKTHQ